MTPDETRQKAIGYALAWATRADRYAAKHRDADRPSERGPNPARIQRLAELAAQARETATMWARIAPLLPAILDDTHPAEQAAPDQCCQLCPCTGAKDQAACNPCCACSKTRTQQCPSRRTFDDYEERCERTAGHHGIHTARGLQWSNPRSDRTNAAPTTSQSSPEPVAVSLPGQRPNTEDAQPRCLSRYQAADGVERCERTAGHHGIHQGVTVGWRTEQAIIGPDYAAADRCPSRFQAAGTIEGCAEPAGHIGPHRGATCQWFSVHAIPPDQPEPTVVEPSCCETAVRAAAAHLRVHARNAPGLSAYERRCLEDAVDFLTHHATREQP